MERRLVNLDDWLLRRSRSNPLNKYLNPDGSATSRAFKLRESDNGELSVNVERLTTPEISVLDRSSFILFKLHNLDVNNLELKTYHDELEDGTNDAHAVIVGMQMDDDILPGQLARISQHIRL